MSGCWTIAAIAGQGGTYFLTINPRDRRSDLLVAEIATLRDAVRTELARRPFHIDAWVVLPDHMHSEWILPEGDADFSGRMREIRAGFTRRIARQAERTIGTLRQRESGIWQRRFWEHTIRDERDHAAHGDVWRRVYIRWNGVALRVMRFMAGNGSEVIGVTAHSG
jgi:putative transposase